jgi:alcohol oxidase
MWVDKRNGLRQNVPHGFIYPVLDAGNTGLQVATDTKVSRILFDSDTKRANAVEYVIDQETGTPHTEIVYARKQVILAAGGLGSPQILERSGVGNSELLSKLDIPVVADLPGVGSNYQDHNLLMYTYKSGAPKDASVNELLSGGLSLEEALDQKKTDSERYLLGWNGMDCFGKFRPTEKEIESFAPALKQLWEDEFKNRAEKPLIMLGLFAGYVGDYTTISEGEFLTCGCYNAYPYSQGLIHIKSSSPFDPPLFDPGFLSNPADLEQLVYGYKLQREIVRRMFYYRGVLEITQPAFPPESKANYEYVDALSQEKGFAVPIEYSSEDDEIIRDFIRERVATSWHSMATCAMKKRDAGGVVDDRLNVYGVQGLKITGMIGPSAPLSRKIVWLTRSSTDLSICPKNVGANTYSTALAIGEKAATIIAEDLGIQL